MNSLRSAVSFQETFKAIDQFLTAHDRHKAIDQNLNVVEKKGFRWVLLCLLAPFYRFFGQDPYSHVRIQHVADRVLELCQENEAQLSKRLIRSIKERILTPLSQRTKGKYQAHFAAVAAKLDALVYSEIPQDYLKPYRLDDPASSSIDISKARQDEILEILLELFAKLKTDPEKYRLEFSKIGTKSNAFRTLQVLEETSQSPWDSRPQSVRTVRVPLSFHVEMRRGLIHDVILLSKNIIGGGGQTKVRACFGLLTSRFLARKKIPADGRQALMPLLKRNLFTPTANRSADRGLVAVEVWKPVMLKGHLLNNEGIQLFERLAEGTLAQALQSSDLCAATPNKKWVIGDLLHGLSLLHAQEHPGFQFSPPQDLLDFRLGWITVPPFKVAHVDLKLSNVLVKVVNGILRAQITDFGSLNPAMMSYSLGFSSPERIEAAVAKRDGIAFHQKYAQLSDIWSMGLMCVAILKGKFRAEDEGWSVLPSIAKKWTDLRAKIPNDLWKQSRDIALSVENTVLSQLTQEEIDRDLAVLSRESAPELEPLWALVGQMLRIAPESRITAVQALRRFQESCPEY